MGKSQQHGERGQKGLSSIIGVKILFCLPPIYHTLSWEKIICPAFALGLSGWHFKWSEGSVKIGAKKSYGG